MFSESVLLSCPITRSPETSKEHRGFRSKILGNRRDVLVYLPRGYRRWSRKRYPVLYLHDGQNVFDAATAFNGVEWGVDETAQRLIRLNLIEPLIIVAVANTGEERIHEYAPTRGKFDKRRRSKGLLKNYGRFLTEELKPFIDSKYRTHRGRGIDCPWRFVARRSGDTRARSMVSKYLFATGSAFAIGLVG